MDMFNPNRNLKLTKNLYTKDFRCQFLDGNRIPFFSAGTQIDNGRQVIFGLDRSLLCLRYAQCWATDLETNDYDKTFHFLIAVIGGGIS